MLASWREGEAKSAILDFVALVSEKNGPHHVPPSERIAVFDNDGTLWCEHPLPVQAFFLAERVKQVASSDGSPGSASPSRPSSSTITPRCTRWGRRDWPGSSSPPMPG
jgi:hypothetical protein